MLSCITKEESNNESQKAYIYRECLLQGRKKDYTKGIMVHSTGANNPNLRRYVGPDDGLLGVNQYNNHWNQDRPDGRQVCVHAFIGKLKDGSIATYQTLPWNHRGWHAGGDANNTHIGFEICEDGLTTPRILMRSIKKRWSYVHTFIRSINSTRWLRYDFGHYEGYQRGIASIMLIQDIGFKIW